MTKFLTVVLERSGTPESLRDVSSVNEKNKIAKFCKKIKFWPDSEKQLCSGWPNFRSDSVSNFFSSNNRKTFFSFKILQSSWNYLTTLFSRLQIFHFSRKKCNFLNRLCGVKLLFPVLNLATRGGMKSIEKRKTGVRWNRKSVFYVPWSGTFRIIEKI